MGDREIKDVGEKTFTFYAEGKSAATQPASLKVTYTPTDGSGSAVDTLLALPVKMGIDVDSDNSGTIDAADDILEARPGEIGMAVPVNNDSSTDIQKTGTEYKNAKAGILRKIGKSVGDLVKDHTSVVTLKKLDGSTGDVRVWKIRTGQDPVLMLDTATATGGATTNDGDGHPLFDIIAQDSDTNILVAASKPGEVLLGFQLTVNGAKVGIDVVRVQGIVDLDVDSDNKNGLADFTPTADQDKIEDDDTKLGKLVQVNDGDKDHDDIPDFADGFDKFPSPADANTSEAFTPLVLTLSENIDLTKAKIRFTYSASDPDGVTKTGSTPEFVYTAATGEMRIWAKKGSEVRKKASIAAASSAGDFVPATTGSSDAGFVTSKLGFTTSVHKVTLYIEGIAPSTKMGASQIKVEVDPKGEGATHFVAVDTVRVTVFKLCAEVANANDATKAVPGTPLMLNDDWDCGKPYTATGGGHNKCEPIWDKDYTDGEVATENDLMKVKLWLKPTDLKPDTGAANVKFKVTGSGTRLWPKASKGAASAIITIPAAEQDYAIADLPKELYAEGKDLGRDVMELTYEHNPTAKYTDTANVDVITLIESQGGTRKVIDAYNSNIDYEVKSSAALDTNYKFYWDLDGNGTRNGGAWESMTTNPATIKYSAAASGTGNVQLPSDAAHRRQEYDIGVKVKGWETAGGLVLTRHIRVALDTYTGTATATTAAARQTEVAGLTTPPASFTDTGYVDTIAVTAGGAGYTAAPVVTLTGGGGNGATATATVAGGAVTAITVTARGTGYGTAPTIAFAGGGGAGATATATVANTDNSVTCSQKWFETNYGITAVINSGNRLQYSTDASVYGLTPFNGAGATRQVWVVMICKAAYDEELKQEDLQSIARHICRHVSNDVYQNWWQCLERN